MVMTMKGGCIQGRSRRTHKIAAASAMTIMIVRIRKRIGGIAKVFQRDRSFAALASRIVTTGDGPGMNE